MPLDTKDERREIVTKLAELLRAEANLLEIRSALSEHEAADIAEAMEDVSDDIRSTIFESLEAEQVAEILEESGEEGVQDYVVDAPVSEIVEIANAMSPDDAADFLEHIEDHKAEAVIAKLEPDHAEEIRELREYDPDTAGGIMTTEFFWAKPNETAAQVLARMKEEMDEVETIHEIFVCNADMKLKGQVSVEDLISADGEQKIGEIMDAATITVGPLADQEIAGRYMQKYDLAVMAVIDPGRRLLGIITVDDIIDVLSEEASEDMYKMAGVGDPKPLEHGAFRRAYKRLPWLLTTIVGMGIIAPFLLGNLFHDTLQSVVALALFIPAIMGLGGNTAIQSSTITVRGLATGEIDWSDMGWMLWREIKVGIIIAITCSILVGTCAYAVVHTSPKPKQAMQSSTVAGSQDVTNSAVPQHVGPLKFASTVALALIIGIMLSVLLGVSIPMCCHRFGVDPAVAAGPFITTLIDITTQTLYLTIATWLLLS
ncbi:MAG: magnesium transporter [Planctomycetes bacterium]|nr:magnesium transporter [Planctomycetota bacterium]